MQFPIVIVGGGGEVAHLLGPNSKVKLNDGRVFDTPSAAANALKKTKGINGWRFWRHGNTPLYQLKQKFLPVPPKELLEAEAKRVKEELRQQRRAAQQAKEEEEARAEARKKAEARQFARETFGEGTTA